MHREKLDETITMTVMPSRKFTDKVPFSIAYVVYNIYWVYSGIE